MAAFGLLKYGYRMERTEQLMEIDEEAYFLCCCWLDLGDNGMDLN